MANVKQLIRDVYRLEEQIAGLKSILQASKAKIQDYFDKHDIKELEVEPENMADGTTLVAKKTERVIIDYFVDKLKESLDKEVFNEVVHKNYHITDINGLIALLKKTGIKPDEFKQFIDVTTTVNKDALKQLYAVGDITKEDLKGCYSAKIVKSISIKPRKGDTD